MKKVHLKRLSIVVLFAMISVVLFSSLQLFVGAYDATAYNEEGRSFSSSDEFSMTNPLTVQPMTYVATVNVPEGASTRGVIFGNYRESDISCLNFEITAEGKPSIFFIDSSAVQTKITFDYDVRGLGFVNLAITYTQTDTGCEFICYVNGESIGTKTAEVSGKISLASCQRQYRFALGHDWYSSSTYFKGAIKNVAIYDKPLSADEIAGVHSSGVKLSDDGLMAYYDLTTAENNVGTRITDATGNGHDFEPLFQETRRDFDYAYSLAVVGDTQHLIYRDAHHNEDWTSPIYDWLVANKDSKKIQFVIGVGDITNRDGKDDVNDGVDKTDVEWELAVNQLNKLYDAGIPYSLVIGNHDSVSKLDKFFADNPNFTGADIEYYSGNSLGNYTMKFDVGQTKYMLVAFEYGPNDAMLAWAGEQVAANPDRKVIISTHAYMAADGTTLEANNGSVPRPLNPNDKEKPRNNGDDIWHEFASKYENVFLVVSGHISASDIIYRKDYGDNGNTVYQMLIDFQTMDTKYSRKTGMVAMFYFSEDGKVVNVEYVSTYRSLAAQKVDPEAKDIVFRPAVNSFVIEYPDAKGVGEETKYGTISPAYLDKDIYPVVLFKSDKTFIGGFYELNHAMISLASIYNDKNESYVMYFRDDSDNIAEIAGDVVNMGSFNGELLIDLNGFTVRNVPNYLINLNFSGDSGNSPTITIKNGTLVKDKNTVGLIRIDYTSTLSKDVNCKINFENVTFRSLVNYNKNTSVVFIISEAKSEGKYLSATATVNVDSVFTDCTFDYVNSISGAVMIPMKHYYKDYTTDRVIFNVAVNGGTALGNTAADFTSRFYLANDNTNGRADSIKFGPNASGEYIKLVLPAGATAPSASYSGVGFDGGDCVFTKGGETAENVTYTMINAGNLKTENYGIIGLDYRDENQYPVIIFEKKSTGYTFIKGYESFNAATNALDALTSWYSSSKTYVIYLRKDTTSAASIKLDQAMGTYIVDLNGFTLSQTNSTLFSVNRNSPTADPNTVSKRFTMKFINGTVINSSGSAMFAINYGAGDDINAQSYSVSFAFEHVTFKFANSSSPIFVNWETDGGNVPADSPMRVNVYATFDDCTFDISKAGKSFVIIDMADDARVERNNRTVYDVKINGGTVISANAFGKANFFAMNTTAGDRNDSVVFGKGTDGKYITLVLPATISAPSVDDVYMNLDGAKCVFSKEADSGENTVYAMSLVPTYTVTFKNDDGSIISSETYYYGDTIIVPADPTKAADETYTYAFKAWDVEVSATCVGDATYVATYEATYIEYTVIFKDENGNAISTETYHYGDAIVVPADPTKAADETYTYAFKAWDSEVSATCVGNATYVATYEATYIEYTVIFKDENGNAISTETYHYGETIVIPTAPTKAADATYTYAFKAWDSEVSATCVGNATYTATYEATYIEYTVIFKDADGNAISTETYHYGDAIVVPEAPTKAADETYTYAFKAWDSEVSATCVGNATYVATYEATYIEYTVIFKDENGNAISTETYHYGDAIVIPTAPNKAADATYTYAFKSWDSEVSATCVGNATYVATYEATYIEYTVIFKDADGNAISTETYHYGEAIVVPEAPTKAADETYTYTFKSWDSEVSATCVGNATYVATYEATYIEYTVIFKDADGSTISSETYHYGEAIVVPADPTKAADENYTYTFKGWDCEHLSWADTAISIPICVGDEIYVATYTATEINNDQSDTEGLPVGAVAGIAAGSTVAVGAGGFALFWFVIKKKNFLDLINIIKK